MSLHRHSFIYLIALITLSLILAACDQSTPTPEPAQVTIECSAGALITAINDANADPGTPAEIHMPANCHITLYQADNNHNWMGKNIYNGLPRINSEITIRGNHSVIDIVFGQVTPFGHFFINPEKTLNLYDLTLSSGGRPYGGSIINDQGDLFLYHVQFLNNRAYAEGVDGAGMGGAIFNYLGKVRIMANSLFQGNMAGLSLQSPPNRGGAVYSMDGSLMSYNSTFLENFAAGNGGAIYTEKTIYNTSGGMILVNNSVFDSNQAQGDGGAIYLLGESAGVYLTSSEFLSNQADGQGGALFMEDSDVSTGYANFYDNQADYGGAVFTRRSATGETSRLASDSSFYTYNTAALNGGAIFSENSDVEMDDSIIVHNTAESCGGLQLGGTPGLDVLAGDLESAPKIQSNSELIDTSIAVNEALSGFGGGACHLMGDLIIMGSSFNGNTSPSYGGGLFTMAEFDASGSDFSSNLAFRGGGLAVGFPLDDNNYVSPSYLDFFSYLRGSYVSNNQAQDAGGGIWTHHGGSLKIEKSTIGSNEANAEGGGVYQAEGNLYIDNSTIAENTAFRGGGLYNHDGITTNPALRLMHTTVAYNTATDTGSELRSGGGGLNINGIVYAPESLVANNINGDCDLNQGLGGDYDYDCGETYCLPGSHSVDSDGSCGFWQLSNIQLGNFNGQFVPILPGSSVIDWSSCLLQDDQIGTGRPQGADCEPGSIEYQATTPPPPPPAPPETGETSDECDPFAGLEFSLHNLSVDPQTLVFPVYLRFAETVPGANEDGSMPYYATLGSLVSYLCNDQGFPDRLYCLFQLTPGMVGTPQNLDFFKEGCEDSAFSQPGLNIPEVLQQESGPSCSEDLGESACAAAGGTWIESRADSYCQCP